MSIHRRMSAIQWRRSISRNRQSRRSLIFLFTIRAIRTYVCDTRIVYMEEKLIFHCRHVILDSLRIILQIRLSNEPTSKMKMAAFLWGVNRKSKNNRNDVQFEKNVYGKIIIKY